MKRAIVISMLAAAAFGVAALQAGQGGNCSPEGTWYGYNSVGNLWIVTVTRSGPDSFTTVMDFGANPWNPPTVQGTDWRGEFVKTGPKSYDWTTMALAVGEEGFPIPFGLGFCPLTAEFTDCDSWQGAGVCSWYGFFSPEDDPFEDGFFLFDDPPIEAIFKRMPMTYPTP